MLTLLELLQLSQIAFLTILGVLGLLIGSFLNLVIYRLPIMLEKHWRNESREFLGLNDATNEESTFNLILPLSQCPKCGHRIHPLNNIPVISFLLLKGKCASCKDNISWQYPLVELICAGLSITAGYYYGATLETAALLPFLWILLTLAVIDINHQLLPDSLTIPLIWGGLVVNNFSLFTTLDNAVLGAIFGYLSLWSVFWLFKLATGKDGMGYGDFKLMAVLGAWLGWQILPIALFLSSLIGTVVTVTLILMKKHDRKKPVPFGPYIILAGILVVFWGEFLANQYSYIIGF